MFLADAPSELQDFGCSPRISKQVQVVHHDIMVAPWTINMEPENHLFEKGNHLPNLHFFGSMSIFRGVVVFYQIWRVILPVLIFSFASLMIGTSSEKHLP